MTRLAAASPHADNVNLWLPRVRDAGAPVVKPLRSAVRPGERNWQDVRVRLLRLVLGVLLVAVWAYGTVVLGLMAKLMSLDEEWRGWGDLLLNQYLVAPYVVASVALLGAAFFLLCPWRRPSPNPKRP